MDPIKTMAAVAKALGLDPETPADKIKRIFEAVLQFATATADEPMPDASPEDVAAARAIKCATGLRKLMDEMPMEGAEEPSADPATMLAAKLMELTGLDAAGLMAALDANADALKALLVPSAPSGDDAGSDVPVFARQATKITALTARADELAVQLARVTADLDAREKAEAERVKLEREKSLDAEIDALVVSGKILEAERAPMRKLAAASIDDVRDLVANRPAAVPTGRVAAPAAPGSVSKSTTSASPEDELVIANLRRGTPGLSRAAAIKAIAKTKANTGA
jgi:hypothetical protein